MVERCPDKTEADGSIPSTLTRMDEKKESFKKGSLPRQGGVKWGQVVGLFSQVSTWIVAPIIVALLLGKYLDTRFGTEPVISLILIALSFLFSCLGIFRVIKGYMKTIQEIADKK